MWPWFNSRLTDILFKMADEQQVKQEAVKTDDDKTQDLAQSGPTETEQKDVKNEIPPPSEAKMKQWRRDFDDLTDVTDHITIADLEKFWQTQNKNPTGDDIKSVLQAADKDGNGEINFEEFVEIQKQAEQHPFYVADIKEELLDALKALDTNGDNTISKEELKGLLHNYDDKDLDEFIEMADTNGDGKLSIGELAELMCPGITNNG